MGGSPRGRRRLVVHRGPRALVAGAPPAGRGRGSWCRPITFCGVASAVLHAGLVPVLADVDPLTATMSPATAVRRCPGGGWGAGDGGAALRRVCRPRSTSWPRPPACRCRASSRTQPTPSARYDGDGRVGSRSRAACFSFYATKNLPIGEGGMVTTDDEQLADRLRCARLHGMSRDAWRRYEPGALLALRRRGGRAEGQPARRRGRRGSRAAAPRRRMAGAAHGRCARLPRAARRTCPAWTCRRTVRPGATPGTCSWSGSTPESPVGRDELVERLAREGVGTSVHFIPLHHLTYHRAAADDARRRSTARTASSPSCSPSPCTRRSPTTRSTVSAPSCGSRCPRRFARKVIA